ncbi:dihydrolipoyl dehydrogenase [Thauera aromatica]|nr:dihydrolipoyl dehydrogenase [Thauera aromatica]MCK2127697.1 dihydrolipoyl dehydrogenase [Thauera aromatica]
MTDNSYDLIVMGAGPGGYVAAIRAAQLGMKTAVVERELLGGICLNWGCIPTKALLRSAEVGRLVQHAADYGVSVPAPAFDLKRIVQRSRAVAARLNGGIAHLLKKNKVTVIEGEARLAGAGRVVVTRGGAEAGTFTAPHLILATGARARQLPGLEDDGRLVWTYRKAMTPDVLPQSLLIVGSGAIGIEFASFYHALGSQVTVVEVMDRILPVEDEDISALARKAFEDQGMRILTGATASIVRKADDRVTARIEAGGAVEELTVDRVIVAVGITPNTENLGLEHTRVRLERGHIVTDSWCRTDEPGLYAIGDVTRPPWLAHKASHEAMICVEAIAGLADVHPLEPRNIPGCTYSHPQIASVGLTERKAREQGYEVRVGRFPFVGNGKAIALGEAEGLVKTVFDARSGELLGAHMIGAEVTELIQGYTLARTLEATEAELIATVFPHPTLSETMHEAVLAAYGRAIHV